MIRRLVYVLLCVILIFNSAGCSSKNTSDNKNITQNVTQPPDSQRAVTQAPIQNAAEPDTDNLESYSLGKSLRFVVLADSRGSDHGVNSEIVKKILSEVKQLSPQPEFAIMPGDLTEGSKQYKVIKAQLDYFKELVTEYYPIEFFYPGIGNHEMKAGKDGEKAFSETFSEFSAHFLKGYHRTSYYIDFGDTRLFMLNSNHPDEKHKITGKQLDWLKSNIDQSKKHNIFLLHEPPYPTGAEAGYSLDKYPAARDAFWKVVDSLNNSIVFCGHEHNYSRRLVDNSFSETIGGKKYKFSRSVYQIISGGFGAPLYEKYTSKKNIIIPPIPQYHFTVVDISESGVSIQAVSIDGETLDSFQIQ
jgi:hypothetical protein